MYKLYKITNAVNGKIYIGITKQTLEERLTLHISHSRNPKYPIQYAINKYGSENFSIELLEESEDRKYISELEEPTIIKYDSRKQGYNIAIGGIGGNLGPEAYSKRKETINNYSLERKTEYKECLRLRNLGKTKENDAGRLSQSEKIKGNKFALGLKHSEETKKLISKANKKPKSQTTRQKMSESAKINKNGQRLSSYRGCCLCCKREFDLGNLIQHFKRMNKNEL
jgi:group I intron endonuclease